MLHVRVVSPAALTERLADRLGVAPGVQNVMVQAGAARRPDGDAVQFDVRDGTANPVFKALRELGLDRDRVICVERVDATLTGQAVAAADRGVLRQETAPIWEMVDAVIRQGEAYAPSFYALLTVAGLIGAVGILTNSQILIVGAMVVGPEYNAIIGVALGITKRNRAELQDGLLALCWGFLAAIAVTLLFGLAVRASGKTPVPFLHGVRPVADLINTPNVRPPPRWACRSRTRAGAKPGDPWSNCCSMSSSSSWWARSASAASARSGVGARPDCDHLQRVMTCRPGASTMGS